MIARRALGAVFLVTSCSRRSPPAPASISTDAGAGAALASSIRSVPQSPAQGCPATRLDAWRDHGTVHEVTVSGNETWTAEGSPHRLPDGLRITRGASVTLVPCALVLAAGGTAVRVEQDAALFAMGESNRPVRIDADGASPSPGAWEGLAFARGARTTSRLVWTRIAHGGSRAAGLTVAMHDLDVSHVTIDESRASGVWLTERGSFATGTNALEIRATHAAGANDGGMPIVIDDADAVGSIPSLVLADNARAEIRIAPPDHATFVRSTQTWRDLGVPYVLDDDRVLAVDGSDDPTLTLAGGVTLALGADDEIRVGDTSSSALVIDVDTDHAVTLRNASAHWRGIVLGPLANPQRTRFHGVRIEGAIGVALPPDACAPRDIARALFVVQHAPQSALFSNLRVDSPADEAAVVARSWAGNARSLFAPGASSNAINAAFHCIQTPLRSANGRCEVHPRCDSIDPS